jgi:IclR family transcriptional regulator, acetate operon repressor
VHAAQAATLQTADRALQVLQELGGAGEALTVTELATRLKIHRSNASRLVATLEARGFVERPASGDLLRLGPEIARLGRVALAGRDLVRVARPAMDQLAAETGETVTLAVAAGAEAEALTVAQADGRHLVGSGNWVGLRMPAHCCSDGKVLLAFGASEPPAGALRRHTPRSITDSRALERELGETRRRGYAVACSELEEGLAGVAVPVRAGDACLAALCVSGPVYRLPRPALETAARAARRAAEVIEEGLGARAPASERRSA